VVLWKFPLPAEILAPIWKFGTSSFLGSKISPTIPTASKLNDLLHFPYFLFLIFSF